MIRTLIKGQPDNPMKTTGRKLLTGAFQAAVRHLSGRVGAFQSTEWALVKRLTGTDEVVDQALNDQKSRK